MRIIMLGAPGAGKGTQAVVLSQKYNIPHISTGDIFRYNIKSKTELGEEASSYMSNGDLVPDDTTVNLVIDRIKNDDCKNGYILDGFPRTIQQAEMFDEYIEKDGLNIDKVILLSITNKVAEDRIVSRRICNNCGATYNTIYKKPKVENICDVCGERIVQREDDKLETVLARLETYEKQTSPLIEYYRKKNKLVKIVGQLEISDTTIKMLSILGI